MHKLRIVAIGAAVTSALCVALAIVAHAHGSPVARMIFVLTAVGSGFSVMPIYCTALSIRALQHVADQVCDQVAGEARALHRAMVVTMEQYGDRRAVDAVVAAERRRNVNERGQDTTDLAYLGRVNAGNVTPIHKR